LLICIECDWPIVVAIVVFEFDFGDEVLILIIKTSILTENILFGIIQWYRADLKCISFILSYVDSEWKPKVHFTAFSLSLEDVVEFHDGPYLIFINFIGRYWRWNKKHIARLFVAVLQSAEIV